MTMQGLEDREEQMAPSYAPVNVLHPEGKRNVSRILIVDDDEHILRAMRRSVRRLSCDVITASSGQEAIQVLQQHEVALVISDEHMSGIKGTEVLKHALELQPDALRIIVTADRDLETVIQAINIGQVSQYLAKPWDDTTLRQTIVTCLERYQLVQENKRLQQLIYSQHKELSENHEHLRFELKLGSRIHEVLLLSRVPQDIQGINMDAMTVPSKEIDGDFYDFYRPTTDVLDVVIGDVMGKGLPAALVGTAVKTQLMRFAVPYNRGQLCQSKAYWHDNLHGPEEILTQVHHETALQLIDLGYFVSLFYARFNLARHTISYVDCGFTKPLHYKAKDKKIHLLKGTNFPIGMVEEDFFHTLEIPFGESDIFVFYSDGVTEAMSPENQLFGVERLTQIVEANTDSSPTQLLRTIRHSVLSFARKDYFEDDLTIIIMKIGEDLAPRSHIDKTAHFAADLSQIEAVREFVDNICKQAPGDAALLSHQLQLAINEAFVNIVKHSYEGVAGEVIIHAEIGEEGILIELSDQGKTFNPAEAPEPSLAGDRYNNFGLYIIKQVADVLNYVPKDKKDTWNHLRLFKKYHWEKKLMEFTHANKEDVLIVTLEGNSLDAREAPHLKDRMTDMITSQKLKHVVFDLNQLEFIDSSGLGSLLSILRLLNSQDGDLKLASVPAPIQTMFEIVRMHKLFEIHKNCDDAVHSFK